MGLVTVFNKENILELFTELRLLFNQRKADNKAFKVKRYYDSFHQMVKIYAGALVFGLISTMFPLIPFVLDGSMELKVAYFYPFDPYQKENYLIALFWVNWTTLNAFPFLLGSDIMLNALITVISMEFDALRFDFVDLSATLEHEKKLEILVKRHTKLLDLCEKLQKIYGMTFLYSFVISSLMMSSLVFLFLTSSSFDFVTIQFYVSYFIIICGRIFLLLLYGQKLIDSSCAVSDGVYDCGWQDITDESLKKRLVTIILRGQRPIALSAMGFADASLQTFMQVKYGFTFRASTFIYFI